MRTIDLKNWTRREHFEFFKSFDHPHFGLCANVDLTAFHKAIKRGGFTFTPAIVYVIARAANAIPEFRQRMRGKKVVEHEVVHPSFTVLVANDLFSFCQVDYCEDFGEFARRTVERIAYRQAHPTLQDEPGHDDLLYMTALPWVSFISFMHPMHLRPGDSVPRFAWGKYFKDGRSLKMPLGVQAHHALLDGVHMGRYYEEVQRLLDRPDFIPKRV